MPFPLRLDALWTISGSLPLPPNIADTIVAHIGERIATVRPVRFDQGPARLHWSQSFRQFILYRDWELLGGIDSGDIAINGQRLIYRFRFSHVLLLCLAASTFAGLFIGSGSTALKGLQWGIVAMVWLAGANYAVTLFQIRRFLRLAIEAA